MMKRPVTFFALLLVAVSAAACLDDDITGTRPLSFTISVDPAFANVGDSVSVRFEAMGTQLLGVLVNYGDGVVDTLPTDLAGTVEFIQTLSHAYSEPGTFQIVGQVESGFGIMGDTTFVEIESAGGGS